MRKIRSKNGPSFNHFWRHLRHPNAVLRTICFVLLSAWAARGYTSSSTPFSRETKMNWLEDATFRSFCAGVTSFVCLENVMSLDLIEDLKEDSKALRAAGFGNEAGIVVPRSSEMAFRRNVHQIWLQSPGAVPAIPKYLVGRLEARDQLQRKYVDVIRDRLEETRKVPPHLVELSYLSYRPGSYYRKHVDTPALGNSRKSHERSVSFILYLGGDDSWNKWDCRRDGGALRVYTIDGDGEITRTAELQKCDSFTDYAPLPGTMLLFDSRRVPHEVLETHRNRHCIVGWFGSPTVGDGILLS